MPKRKRRTKRLDVSRSKRVRNGAKNGTMMNEKISLDAFKGNKKIPSTPMVVSTHNKNYLLPTICRGKHKFEDAILKVSFVSEDEGQPYHPFPMYPRMCIKCLEFER